MIDPYGIKQGDTAWDIGNYANTWEVTVLPTVDKSKEYAALYPQLRGLLEDLKHVQPREMSHEQRLAFWINIYHSLILHVFTTMPSLICREN
jgi:erythromycin esterase-like protein